MTRILALDPGHTTGVAVYGETGFLEVSMAVPYATVFLIGYVNELVSFCRPTVILIESLPHNRIDPLTNTIWHQIKSKLEISKIPVVEIMPSQWKGLTTRVEIPGQHARDAATMAKWYIEKDGTN